ncbi:ubiquitin-conjugating enzyme E2 24 [Pelomyxa schiedti]|nr:ubiquitin-conjugating enzyme E2 24 [Pelomyxa schiedti]
MSATHGSVSGHDANSKEHRIKPHDVVEHVGYAGKYGTVSRVPWFDDDNPDLFEDDDDEDEDESEEGGDKEGGKGGDDDDDGDENEGDEEGPAAAEGHARRRRERDAGSDEGDDDDDDGDAGAAENAGSGGEIDGDEHETPEESRAAAPVVARHSSEEGIVGGLGDHQGVRHGDDTGDQQPEDPNSVWVMWLHQEGEQLVPIDKLVVLDRWFAIGDAVVSKANPNGQSGVVISLKLFLDLRFPDGTIKRNVPASAARPVHDFPTSCCVVHGNWIGAVQEASISVWIQMDDSTHSVCRINDPSDDEVHSTDVNEVTEDAEFPLYPSQKVTVSRNALRSAKWIRGKFKPSVKTGVITCVKPQKVSVNWSISRGQTEEDFPAERIKSSELTPLSYFHKYDWAVGDHAVCVPDVRLSLFEDLSNADTQTWHHPKSSPLDTLISNNTACVICKHSFLDIEWQDASISHDIPSVDLATMSPTLHEEFWPHDFVRDSQGRTGIIRKVDSLARMCTVRWSTDVYTPPSSALVGTEEEEVPTFNLIHHPDFNIKIQDVVLRLPTANDTDTQGDNQWVGQVLSMQDGYLCVIWIDGSVSRVPPEEVFLAPFEEEQDYDDNESSEEEEEEEGGSETGDHANNEPQQESSGSSLWWAQGSRILNAIAESLSDTSKSTHATSRLPTDYTELPSGSALSTPLKMEGSKGTEESPSEKPTPSVPTAPNTVVSSIDNTSVNTPAQFDVVDEGTMQHHWENNTPNSSLKLAKRIVSEWEILRASSSSGIYVRVYENRMDLLRVAIIGPCDTPFEDGFFMFDLALPPDYPAVPPDVFFHSLVPVKINPNLYTDGTVCLSLLGTWVGDEVESWQPDASNLLQVILSIQGLILGTNEPYFLEAGYDKQRGMPWAAHQSHLYNEGAVLGVLQGMLYTMAAPPPPFERVVLHHFATRGRHILQRCRSLLNKDDTNNNTSTGTGTGTVTATNTTPDADSSSSVQGTGTTPQFSRAFIVTLTGLLPQLEEAIGQAESRFHQL